MLTRFDDMNLLSTQTYIYMIKEENIPNISLNIRCHKLSAEIPRAELLADYL